MSEEEKATLFKTLGRVLSLLENDDKTGRKGLVHQSEDHGGRLSTIEEKLRTAEAVKAGQMAIYGAFGAFCLWILGVIAKLLFPFLLKFL